MSVKAVILGLSGPAISDEERQFFSKENPLGFILFARNCQSPEQIKALTSDLRACVGRADAPILIDQEGGRVARLKPPHFRKALPAGIFAALAVKNIDLAEQAVILNSRLMAHELRELGITVDCAPVADLLFDGAHSIIGDRSFGADVAQVVRLAGAMCRGLIDGGIVPIIKHIPGHGRAKVDSHEKLPVVSNSKAELDQTDFAVFKGLATAPWAMTAHIIYSAIDPDAPATLSPKVIEMIRNDLDYSGIIISDDLSMHALSGDFSSRTRDALAAGCDLVLHCNGKMEEMSAVVAATLPVSPATQAKLQQSYAINHHAPLALAADSEARLQQMIDGGA